MLSAADVVREVLKLVEPSEEERRKARVAEEILKERLSELGVEYIFVGSYARDTWLRNNLEIDVFLLFPPEMSREELERKGLEIGKAVLDDYEIRYAEHPYVHGRVKGVEVDVVPCYKLDDPREIKSAVDRTPFHHRWLKDRITGKEGDVRVLKGFLKANSLYGAEYKVRGFSGYLCELLIIHYGSFLGLVENAREWTRRTVIDVAKGEIRKGDSFFVVDPVDEKRNVAANLSIDNLAKFVHLCREFMKNPSIDFFSGLILGDVQHFSITEVESEIQKRQIVCVKFEKPDIVEDNLYPQLERACRKISEFLDRSGFSTMRSCYAVGKYCYLLFECEVVELSPVEKRMGPPFEEEEHVRRFLERWENSTYSPFIERGRWWVYVERKLRRTNDAVSKFISENWRALGKNVGEIMKESFEILTKDEIGDIYTSEDGEVRKKLEEFLFGGL